MLKMGITIIKPDYNENFITLRKVFMQNIISVICCILMISYFSLGYAADIPNGVVLAEKQELVRQIKDEPASLDPAKAVGLPEIQVIRDLYEGLVNQLTIKHGIPCH